MKKLKFLRISNHVLLALSVLGYIFLWFNNKEDIKTLESFGLFDSSFFQGSIIAAVIISIFLWLFIETFCENTQDSNEHNNELLKQSIKILSYFENNNFHNLNKKIDKKTIAIKGEDAAVETNEILVKVKTSGKIQKIKKSDWDDIVKIGNEDMFEIIN